jgi:pyruvate formate-lyase activating enzyme-like uncharacterized protein
MCWCVRKEFRDNAACVGSPVDMTAIESALAAAIRKLFDLCDAHSSDKSGKSNGLSDVVKSVREVQRQIKAANDKKSSLYDQYCDGGLARNDYIRLRDAEDETIAALNVEMLELESRQAEPMSEIKERVGSLGWNGILDREIVNALITRVLVYDGGRVEIEWAFSDPFKAES